MRFATPLAILATLTLSSVAAAQRQVITLPGANPNPTLSTAIKYGDVVYLSGSMGLARPTPDTTIQGQTKLALENLSKAAQAAGTTLSNALKCTVFLTDVKDFPGMNEAYRQFFPKEPPARSTVVVAALVSAGAKTEIECIVGMPK